KPLLQQTAGNGGERWCPRPGSNRHDREVEGFSYHFGFRRRPQPFVVWSTPSPWRSCAVGARRLLSTPSFRERKAWLGVGADRSPGRSPTLTGATPGVSPGGLNYSSPLCLPIS